MDQAEREDRLEALFSNHASDVLAYGMRRGASRVDAEDMMIETFIVCCRHMDEMRDPGLPWLIAVARRVLANQRRSRSRRSTLLEKIQIHSDRPEPQPDFPRHMADEELMGAIRKLSDVDRESLFLVAWEGLTHEEAAQVAGCSRSAFTRRFRHARRRLRAHLERDRTQSVLETDIRDA